MRPTTDFSLPTSGIDFDGHIAAGLSFISDARMGTPLTLNLGKVFDIRRMCLVKKP